MWVTALNIVTLVLMLGVLAYVGLAARRLDASLTTLLDDQGERLRRIERDLDRVRQALEATGLKPGPTNAPGYSPRAGDDWARRNGSRRAGCSAP
jgi:hypothetical protein